MEVMSPEFVDSTGRGGQQRDTRKEAKAESYTYYQLLDEMHLRKRGVKMKNMKRKRWKVPLKSQRRLSQSSDETVLCGSHDTKGKEHQLEAVTNHG